MATALRSLVVSPASTHCSELEYLIALQDSESSQLRRSQRLREKDKSKTEVVNNGSRILSTSGSPQLFVETDEECSQLAQVLQVSSQKDKRIVTKRSHKNRRPSKPTQINHGLPNILETTVQQPKGMQTEPTLVSLMQTNTDCKICTLSEPSIISSETPKNDENQPQLLIKRRRTKKLQETAPILSEPLQADSKKLVRSQKRKSNLSTSVIKRKCSEKRNESEQKSTTVHDDVKICNIDQNCKQEISVLPAAPKSNTLFAKTTDGYTYNNLNVTQTILPARYPAHFIYQLSPKTNLKHEVAVPQDVKHVGLEEPISLLSSHTLREICPTPDTTPLVTVQSCTPSPPNVESIASTTPSLSDSLAEVFGTKKIHEALNIEIPRRYLVLEDHLPAIALMLDVELARLRAVLGLTQRLTPEQLHQMTKDSLDVMSEQ